MKSIHVFFIIMILLLLTSCGTQNVPEANQTSSISAAPPQTTDTPADTSASAAPAVAYTPVDLLGPIFNPFYDLTWPEGYTVYQVCYESGEFNLYRLYMTATGSAEDVVTMIADMVGLSDNDNIAAIISDLNQGEVQISDQQFENGIDATIEIYPADPDSDDYDDVDGYAITLATGIDSDQATDYAAILDANFNADAMRYIDADSFIDSSKPVFRQIKVLTYRGAVQAEYMYQDDYETWQAFFTSDAYTDSELVSLRIENSCAFLNYEYGNLGVNLTFDDESQIIWLSQYQNDTEVNISEYVPEQTLQSLGFKDVNEDGVCGFDDEMTKTAIHMTKAEWGAEKDSVTFMIFEDYDPFIVIYDPSSTEYSVEISKNNKWARYLYTKDRVKPLEDDDTTDEIIHNMAQITGDDSQSNTKIPITMFNTFIEDTFDMSLDALFELPYE